MLSFINFTVAVLWSLSAFFDYNEFAYILQLKEYRLDKLRDFFSTKLGQSYWRRYSILWRSILVIVALMWPINNIIFLKYLLLIIFGLDFLRNVRLFLHKKLKHPVFTTKAVVLISLALLIESGVFLYTKDWAFIFLFLILRFFIITFIVQILNIPTKFLKKYYLIMATKKLSRYPNIITIGITGSYGKTSVKTFLSHILSEKFSVLHTPKNINTEIGIAKFILSQNLKGVEIFVVEMGAYKIGEIKLICQMVKPKFGILTAINEQHLSLFGNIKNTQTAKYELLNSIDKSGYVIVNSDSDYARELLHTLKAEVATFGTNPEFKPTFYLEDVSVDYNFVLFKGRIKETHYEFKARVVGAHNSMNLAPCVLAALKLGMTKEEIHKQLMTLVMPDKTLVTHQYGLATVIDDSYNANKNGFLAALDLFSNFSSGGKRIVVTRGIPELGEASNQIHEEIGGAIAYSADELVVITKDFFDPLKMGVGTSFNTEVKLIDSPNELLKYFKNIKATNAVILIENRIPDNVYKEITS